MPTGPDGPFPFWATKSLGFFSKIWVSDNKFPFGIIGGGAYLSHHLEITAENVKLPVSKPALFILHVLHIFLKHFQWLSTALDGSVQNDCKMIEEFWSNGLRHRNAVRPPNRGKSPSSKIGRPCYPVLLAIAPPAAA